MRFMERKASGKEKDRHVIVTVETGRGDNDTILSPLVMWDKSDTIPSGTIVLARY